MYKLLQTSIVIVLTIWTSFTVGTAIRDANMGKSDWIDRYVGEAVHSVRDWVSQEYQHRSLANIPSFKILATSASS